MRILTFLNIIQHIVFNRILSLQLKNKTILQFECFFVQLVWHLQLGVGLAYFLHHSLETLRRHHERLLDLVVLLRILVDRKIIVNLIFLFFKVLLEMRIVLCSQRNNHPCLPLLLRLIILNTFIF